MDLQDPRKVSIDGATKNLLTQVSAAKDELDGLRPFSEEVRSRLRKTLLPDRIVASLNMEGIIATRRQTLDIMNAISVRDSFKRGEREIYNALKADEFVCDAVDRGETYTAGFFREINRIVLQEINPEAGLFRPRNIELPGAPLPPPHFGDVPSLIEKLCEIVALSESLHPVMQAAWVHDQFTLIHPFVDGNGRAGRLLQDFSLMRRGLLPIGIPPAQRDDYYSALASADLGKWNDFVEMLALLELSTISKTVAIAKEPERRRDWIQQLSAAAVSRQHNTLHKRYLVWRHRMETLSSAFAQAASELDEASEQLGAEMRQFGVLDFSEWKKMCQYGALSRSWLFSIVFFADGEPFYKTIAALRRHRGRGEMIR